MPKYLVHQKLPPGTDPIRGHLRSVAEVVAASLNGAKPVPVTWLWGCANLETNEYHMLFSGPDEATVRETIGEIYGLVSIARVMFVDSSNIARMMLRGLAETQPMLTEADGPDA